MDQSAVRFTRGVDLLIRRSDMPAAIEAMEKAGFLYSHTLDVTMFLDGPEASPREAVHVVFAGEKVREHYPLPAPQVEESEPTEAFTVLSLAALVRMKLTSYRDRDKTHLRDMLDVGLIDPSWREQLPPQLAERLQWLLDTPDG